MAKRAVMYLRVSTRDQTTENQQLELERVAAAKGWVVTEIYRDEGVSGAKGRDQRPSYDAMLRDAVRSKFDVIMSWDVSRLGRSLAGLVSTLDDLHANGVDLYLHQQALDTTTPSGKALFQMCGVFAEFERAMISERVKAGLRRAKTEGRKLGRPAIGLNLELLRADRAEGLSLRVIARKHGVSVGLIHRALSEKDLVTPDH